MPSARFRTANSAGSSWPVADSARWASLAWIGSERHFGQSFGQQVGSILPIDDRQQKVGHFGLVADRAIWSAARWTASGKSTELIARIAAARTGGGFSAATSGVSRGRDSRPSISAIAPMAATRLAAAALRARFRREPPRPKDSNARRRPERWPKRAALRLLGDQRFERLGQISARRFVSLQGRDGQFVENYRIAGPVIERITQVVRLAGLGQHRPQRRPGGVGQFGLSENCRTIFVTSAELSAVSTNVTRSGWLSNDSSPFSNAGYHWLLSASTVSVKA